MSDQEARKRVEGIETELVKIVDIMSSFAQESVETREQMSQLREGQRILIGEALETRERLYRLEEGQQSLIDTQRSLMNSMEILTNTFTQTLPRIDEMQSEIKGLQTENRRILERLENL